MKYIFSIRRSIIIIFIIALAYALIYDFFLKDYLTKQLIDDTPFSIFERIAFSLIATTIFFIFNQHYPREKKKDKTLNQLKTSVSLLQVEIIYLFQSLDIASSFEDIQHKIF